MSIAAPTVGTRTEQSSSTSTVVPYPSVVHAGDLMVLSGSVKVINASATTLPSGWTLVSQTGGTGGTTGPCLFVAIKIAAGTEGGSTLTVAHVSGGPSAWQILAFAGVDNVTPQDVAHSNVDASPSSMVIPGVTIATDQAALVAIGAQNSASSGTQPSGFTETADIGAGATAFEVSYKLGNSTGATGNQTLVWSGSGRGLGVLLALRPATVAPTGITTPHIGTMLESASAASSVVSYPATVNAGDLIVLCGSIKLIGAATITTPAGFTAVDQLSPTGNTFAPAVYMATKSAAGTEGGTTVTVTHTTGVSAWQILAFPGVDSGTPQDVAHTTVDSNTGSTTVLPSQTIVTSGAAQVYIVGQNVSTGNATPATGFTETADRSSGTASFEVAYKLNVVPGASGTVTATWGASGKSAGILLALRPGAPAFVATDFLLVGGVWTDAETLQWDGTAWV